VRRSRVALLVVLAASLVVAVVAAVSRGGDSKSKQPAFHPQVSQQYGDDADLMRKLERKKLVDR
jgi:hypothetical protein